MLFFIVEFFPFQELVEYNADLNLSQPNMGNFFSTPLYIAIAYERLSCFKELLLGGADPDFTSRTASIGQNTQSLYHAVVKHNVNVNFAEFLYQFGANLYVKNSKGQYPWNMQGYDNACRDYILGVHGKYMFNIIIIMEVMIIKTYYYVHFCINTFCK